jgi:hypothetical protein
MTTGVALQPHADLGASKAERWMACPGSVRLSAGLQEIESEYARDGMLAHAYAALQLSGNGSWPPPEGVVPPEDVLDAADRYVDYAREIMRRPGIIEPMRIEHSFSLDTLNPPAPMYGTADLVALQVIPNTENGDGEVLRLIVADLKTGAGVVVEAVDNAQAQYYALGALLQIERDHPEHRGRIVEVEIVIMQPRAYHVDGPVRRWTVAYDDLLGFTADLLAAAHRTMAPNAPLMPGDHCRFCPAAGRCPALARAAQEAAQIEFDTLPTLLPPDPNTLPVETLTHVLDNVDIIEGYLRAVRATAQARLERGEPVPGYKLVAKKANRQWVDVDRVENFALMNGLVSYAYETKLRSPRQLELVLKPLGIKVPEDLAEKVSSGYTLAHESDSRPAALIAPEHEFAALPPAELAND